MPARERSQTARYLRADIPYVTADDRFIAVLADLAGSSTPTSDRAPVARTGLGVRIAAVAASVALVSVGASYAVDRFGSQERAPVEDTDTVDPADPSEPAERYENRNEDRAPHDTDGGRGDHPFGEAGNGDQDDTGLLDDVVGGSKPEGPAAQGQAGQVDTGHHESNPKGDDPGGGDTPGDSPDPTDDADPEPDVDPDDPDTDEDDPDENADDDRDDPDTDRDNDAEEDDR